MTRSPSRKSSAPAGLGTMFITGHAEADALLNRDGTALLIGMLLDQQVPMEWAFLGPATVHERLGTLDPSAIAALGEQAVVDAACAKPAIHRFPAVMGRRIHALCVALAERYDGDGANVWCNVSSGDELYARLRTLPGYGEEKSKIMVAILGKRFGVRPAGWRAAAGVFADERPRSVADITDSASLGAVRAWKRATKAAGRDKQDRPLNPPETPAVH